MTEQKQEALDSLAASRRALHQAIHGLSEEDVTQVQVEGIWTIKDVLGHIASWEETYLAPLRRYADGGPFEAAVIEDYTPWNEEQADRKRHIPLSAILDELNAIRQELVATASRLSTEQWQRSLPFTWGGKGTVAQALDILAEHEWDHVRTIQHWRENRGRVGLPKTN